MDNVRVAKRYGLDDGCENDNDNEFMNEFLAFHSKLPLYQIFQKTALATSVDGSLSDWYMQKCLL